MCDIWAGVARVSAHARKQALVIVACQQGRLCLGFAGVPAPAGSWAADLH